MADHTEGSGDEDEEWQRLQVYLQHCQAFKTPPMAELLALFRHSSVGRFSAPPTFQLTNLLPFAECLAYDNRVTLLDFSSVSAPLGDIGAHTLAYALAKNRTIEHLNLSYNGIGPEGIALICKALEKSKSIVTLRLRGNNAGREGGAAIAKLIRRNLYRLRYVDCSNNGLTIEGVHVITAALKARAAQILKLQEGAAAAMAAAEREQGEFFGDHRGDRDNDGASGGSTGAVGAQLMGRSRVFSTSANESGAADQQRGDRPPSRDSSVSGLRRRRSNNNGTSNGNGAASRSSSRSTASSSRRASIDLAAAAAAAAAASTDALPSSVGWLWGGLADLRLSTDLVVRASWEDVRGKMTSSSTVSSRKDGGLSARANGGNGNGGGSNGSGGGGGSGSSGQGTVISSASGVFPGANITPSPMSETEPSPNADGAHNNGTAAAATAAGGAGEADGRAQDGASSSSSGSGSDDTSAASAASRARREAILRQLKAATARRIPELQIRISGNFVKEEVASAALHGVGFMMALFGSLPVLMRKAHLAEDPSLTLGLLLYSGGLLAFFGSSTLRHSLFLTDAAQVFRLIDHTAIFFLIGATYSPFLLTNLRQVQPAYATALFIAVWALVVFGAAVCSLRIPLPRAIWKLFIRANRLLSAIGVPRTRARPSSSSSSGNGSSSSSSADSAYAEAAAALLEDTLDPPLYRNLRLWVYMLAGWLGLLPFITHYHCLPGLAWALLGGGGALFSVGIFTYKGSSRLDPNKLHTTYYSLVLLASLMHWLAVYRYSGRQGITTTTPLGP